MYGASRIARAATHKGDKAEPGKSEEPYHRGEPASGHTDLKNERG